MVQFMTFMASYINCMTRLIANFSPKYCIFVAGLYFFCSFGAVWAHLVVGGPPIVKTLPLVVWDETDVQQAELLEVDFIKDQILFPKVFSTSFCIFAAFFNFFWGQFWTCSLVASDYQDFVLSQLRITRRWISWTPWYGFHHEINYVPRNFFNKSSDSVTHQ